MEHQLPLIIAFVLLAHHYVIHPELQLPDRLFQVKDVKNHETWILLLLTVYLLRDF